MMQNWGKNHHLLIQIGRNEAVPKSTGGKQRRSQRQTQDSYHRNQQKENTNAATSQKKWKLHLKSSISPRLAGFKSQTIITVQL